MRPRLADERDVGGGVGGQRLDERHVRRARQMPVLRVADHEIEDLLALGKHDEGGVADPGAEPVDPVLAALVGEGDAQERLLGSLLAGRGGGERGQESRCENRGRDGSSHGPQLLVLGVGRPRPASTSRAPTSPWRSTARALFSASSADEV